MTSALPPSSMELRSVGLSVRQAMSTSPPSTAVLSGAASLKYWTKTCALCGVLVPEYVSLASNTACSPALYWLSL